MIFEPSRLEGEVRLSGAKNSVLKLLTASILTSSKVELKNYPETLLDAGIHVGMLEKLGKSCHVSMGRIVIEESQDLTTKLTWDDRSIRNTLLMLGALTTRFGSAKVPLPGGCKLGDRSFDLHVMVLERLGARVSEEGDYLVTEVIGEGKRLKGTDIHLPIRSTGATENAIIAGSLAIGTTTIWNPHIRPEIIDLVNFLNTMGADIHVYGQERIVVNGVDSLDGIAYTVMPDNMEAITWLAAAVTTKGDVEIVNFPKKDLEVALIQLESSGAKLYFNDDRVIVRGGRCLPLEISTGPHPGINSDVQPILAAYAACANGQSTIVDLRFPGRYGYVEQMAKLGVKYEITGNALKILGHGGKLKGAEVKAVDLRAGAALALCGMVSDGQTIINDAWQILRGYDKFVSKLQALGAHVTLED